MSSDVREQITEWLTGNDTCFLIGAGCSACASKPLIGKLTENVLDGLDQKLLEQFSGLKPLSDRPPTIEDLINYLVRYREILSTITTAETHALTVDEIDEWLTAIKKRIVSEVADDWQACDYHERFLQRLRGARERGPRDIFSLNYDTLLEASLDSLRLPYSDGFRGTNRGWFDPQAFDEAGPRIAYRVHKLHGSINWTRDADGHVRRGRNANEDAADEPVVVYPSEQKYRRCCITLTQEDSRRESMGCMSKPPRARYRTTNWSRYNASLRKRGSLLFWVDKDMTWHASRDEGGAARRSFRCRYPVLPAHCPAGPCATRSRKGIKTLFKLPLRQTAGMVVSLLRLALVRTGLIHPVPRAENRGRADPLSPC